MYDELERLVQTKLNGVIEYTVKYDANGRLCSLAENGVTHIYEYDSLDRLVRAHQEDANGNITVAVENSYDDLGRAKGSAYVLDDRMMSYEVNYKANSNLVNYVLMPTADLQSNISYTYDEFERVVKKQNSFSSTLNYYEAYGYYSYTDAEGEQHTTSLVSTVTFGGNTPHTPSAVYSYTYDNLGNITQIKKDGVIINEYTYDSLGQLTCEEDAVAGKTYIYYYDKSGNITQKDSYPFAEGATRGDYISYLASQKETVGTYIYNNSTWGDLLGVYNGKIILYDAIGNPINWRNAKSLIWEGRRLISQTLNSDDTLTYAYNSDGIRTQKKKFDFITGEYRTYNYVLDGSTIIKETVTDPAYSLNYTLYYLYDESGSIQGFIYNNAYYYFQKNLQGDVVRILNSSGAVVTEYTYDAWGKVLTTTGTLASTIGQYNPFRYRSYYYDSETGFYYLQSRYYDPTVGRFLNADGIIGANGGIEGYNMFAYCNNNPVMYFDPSGLCRQMWRDGKLGPCPGPGKCQDYIDPLDFQNEIRLEQGITDKNGFDSQQPPDHPEFKPPKKGNKKVNNPNGRGKGWLDNKGRVWVPTPDMHGGQGWTVQIPGGDHFHAYPGGHIRRSVVTQPSSTDVFTAISAGVALLFFIVNDSVGGVYDDALIPAAASCFITVFDTNEVHYCEVCGETW